MQASDAHPSASVVAEYTRHPEDAAELVRQLDEIPPDVDAIVAPRQHRRLGQRPIGFVIPS